MNNLNDNQLWFSSSDGFNDPFDCEIDISDGISSEETKVFEDKLFEVTKLPIELKFQFINKLRKNPKEALSLLDKQ